MKSRIACRIRSLTAIAWVVPLIALTAPLGATSLDSQWLTGGHDAAETYYSPLDQINDKNVTSLGYAWSYDLKTTLGIE
jgi:glucose dehydrogenase